MTIETCVNSRSIGAKFRYVGIEIIRKRLQNHQPASIIELMFPEIQANQLTSARATEAEEEIHQHHNDIGKTQGNPGQDQNS